MVATSSVSKLLTLLCLGYSLKCLTFPGHGRTNGPPGPAAPGWVTLGGVSGGKASPEADSTEATPEKELRRS